MNYQIVDILYICEELVIARLSCAIRSIFSITPISRQNVVLKCDRYLINLSKFYKRMFKMNKCGIKCDTNVTYLLKVKKYVKHLLKF